ncbi:ExeM/NucH family extracellular endonuclease [Micrococcales bacterium 31B]|nr:ExeM/NucH family extracellular endonuclease [Micrococcales bacterium 31B]
MYFTSTRRGRAVAMTAAFSLCSFGVVALASPALAAPLVTSACPTGPVSIAEIQGSAAASPHVDCTVTTSGVVTAAYPVGNFNGFVVQTGGTGGAYDAARTASDAIFVYSPAGVASVAIGQSVTVTGVVSEFNGLTEITAEPAAIVALPEALPAVSPVDLTALPPAAQREPLESMLVDANFSLTVADNYSTNRYGEVLLATGTTALPQMTDVARPGTPEAAAVEASNLERAITLDDGSSIDLSRNTSLTPPYISAEKPLRVGAAVDFQGTGLILDYRNNTWKLNPTAQLTHDDTEKLNWFSNTRTTGPDAAALGAADVKVSSFNVLNYFTTLGTDTASCTSYKDREGQGTTVQGGCDQRGAWDAAQFARQQDKIVAAIIGTDADVLGLMEIENSARLGEAPDEALQSLVAALNAKAGAGTYAYIANPAASMPPITEQDVITNALIYRPAKVTPQGAAHSIADQSGSGEPFSNARVPIAQAFAVKGTGDAFVAIVNHFKSKGSAGPLPGDADAGDGQGASNASRIAQATTLSQWVPSVQSATGVKPVLLLGDFNSYSMEDPLQVLKDAGYADAEQSSGGKEQSYLFGGRVGSLDHVFVNPEAKSMLTGVDIWPINAPESVLLEYSRFNATPTNFYEAGPFRASDHDPVIVGLAADTPPVEPPATPDVFSVPFSQDLFITDNGQVRAITFEEWQQYGYPAPEASKVAYVKYPWSPNVYAIISAEGNADAAHSEVRLLSGAEWAAAKFPTPTVAGWIPGSRVTRNTDSDELFLTFYGQTHKLTFAEWQRAGYPAFSASGVKFSRAVWSDAVFRTVGSTTRRVTFGEWVTAGGPTPVPRDRVAADAFTKPRTSDDITWKFADHSEVLTFEQWARAGFPSPTVTG